MFSKLTNYISGFFNSVGNGHNAFLLTHGSRYSWQEKIAAVDAAMCNPYYASILNDVSESGSNMPLMLTNKKGKEVDINTTNLVILKTPNPELKSTSALIERMLRNWLSYGDALLYTEDNNYSVGFEPSRKTLTDNDVLYCPKNICWTINESVNTNINSFTVTEYAKQIEVEYGRALFISKDNFISKSKYGLSPVAQSQIAVASSNELFYSQERLLKNLSTSGLINAKGDVPILDQERQAIQDRFDELTTGNNKFKNHVISTAIEYTRTGANANDVKAVAFRPEDLRIAANVFGVPAQCFGDTHRTYNNTEEAYIQKDNVVADYVNYLCKELVKYLTDDDDLILQVDRSKVPRLAKQDMETKQKHDDNIINHYQSGILTAQEARAKIYPDLPPLPENQNSNGDNSD